MCGIVGFSWSHKEQLVKAMNLMNHRGPDDSAMYVDDDVSIGMMRLSIIDLKPGIYPLMNEDETVIMFYNGEIYNYKELRLKLKNHTFRTDCDGEVIIHLYEEKGIDFVKELNGMFAISLYDKKTKKIILARDHIGIKPLYYYFGGNGFMFASEIKSLLEMGIPRIINKKVMNHYMTLRYNPLSETIFDMINKLPPAHRMIYDLQKNTLLMEKYWDLEPHPFNDYDPKELHKLISVSVNAQMMSDVPLGLFLSGGIDSSILASTMNQLISEVKTFNVDFEKGKKVNESMQARKVADYLGTVHESFTMHKEDVGKLTEVEWFCDEPMADSALIPLMMLSEKAKEKVTVVITGDGGDELFAGYDHYKLLLKANKYSKIPLFTTIAPLMLRMIPLKILNKVYKNTSSLGREAYNKSSSVIKTIRKSKAKAYYNLLGMFNEEQRKRLLKPEWYEPINYEEIDKEFFNNKNDFLTQLQVFDFKRLLPESFLMKTDRMTMAKSIEARVPLLDINIVKYAFDLKPKHRLRRGKTKYSLRKAYKNDLPKSIIGRKKQTFHVPIEEWLDTDFDNIKELLLTSEIFNQNEIIKIIRDYPKGKLYYARQLWNLITFEVWYRIFIKGEGQ